MIVLDTNVLSELMRPCPSDEVVDFVDRWSPAELFTTSVTAGELRAGVAQLPPGKRRTVLKEMVEKVLADSLGGSVLAFDATSSIHYAEVTAARRRAGAPVSVLDAQIAAICLQHSAALATRKTRDFTGLGLTVVDPWAA